MICYTFHDLFVIFLWSLWFCMMFVWFSYGFVWTSYDVSLVVLIFLWFLWFNVFWFPWCVFMIFYGVPMMLLPLFWFSYDLLRFFNIFYDCPMFFFHLIWFDHGFSNDFPVLFLWFSYNVPMIFRRFPWSLQAFKPYGDGTIHIPGDGTVHIHGDGTYTSPAKATALGLQEASCIPGGCHLHDPVHRLTIQQQPKTVSNTLKNWQIN